MKSQQFALPNGVKVYVPVYKVSPWKKLGYPDLPSVEETNNYILSKIGDGISQVIRGYVCGQLEQPLHAS